LQDLTPGTGTKPDANMVASVQRQRHRENRLPDGLDPLDAMELVGKKNEADSMMNLPHDELTHEELSLDTYGFRLFVLDDQDHVFSLDWCATELFL
jgi:hypothetical protein